MARYFKFCRNREQIWLTLLSIFTDLNCWKSFFREENACFTWLIILFLCIMLYLVIKSFSADLGNHFKVKWCIWTLPESLLLFVFIFSFIYLLLSYDVLNDAFHCQFFLQFEILKTVIIFWIWNTFTYIANWRCATKTNTYLFCRGYTWQTLFMYV